MMMPTAQKNLLLLQHMSQIWATTSKAMIVTNMSQLLRQQISQTMTKQQNQRSPPNSDYGKGS
jgi:hypothetical protein